MQSFQGWWRIERAGLGTFPAHRVPPWNNSLGVEYPIRNVLSLACSLIAIATRNRVYHGTFAVLALFYQLSWIARQFETL